MELDSQTVKWRQAIWSQSLYLLINILGKNWFLVKQIGFQAKNG